MELRSIAAGHGGNSTSMAVWPSSMRPSAPGRSFSSALKSPFAGNRRPLSNSSSTASTTALPKPPLRAAPCANLAALRFHLQLVVHFEDVWNGARANVDQVLVHLVCDHSLQRHIAVLNDD